MTNELRKKSAVITSKSHSVRAVLDGNEMMFGAMDIAGACGIASPTRWLGNFRRNNPGLLNERKLPVWIATEKGPRMIQMIFVNAAGAKVIMENTFCSSEAKKWIQEDVLTYRIAMASEKVAEEISQPMEADLSAERTTQDDDNARGSTEAWNGHDLNRRIDNVLFELLEIKKQVALAAYRA